jgi:hypothetical protein
LRTARELLHPHAILGFLAVICLLSGCDNTGLAAGKVGVQLVKQELIARIVGCPTSNDLEVRLVDSRNDQIIGDQDDKVVFSKSIADSRPLELPLVSLGDLDGEAEYSLLVVEANGGNEIVTFKPGELREGFIATEGGVRTLEKFSNSGAPDC